MYDVQPLEIMQENMQKYAEGGSLKSFEDHMHFPTALKRHLRNANTL